MKGEETKIIKTWGKVGPRSGCLKKGGLEPPYELCIRKRSFYFSDVMKSGHIFPSKICHFQYDHVFLFSRENGNIREYKEVRLKMKNHLGRAFPSHFRQNVFIDTSNVSYLALCHFLMSSSLKIQSTLKDVFSITFSNNNLQRRNMYFEGLFIGLYSIWRPF